MAEPRSYPFEEKRSPRIKRDAGETAFPGVNGRFLPRDLLRSLLSPLTPLTAICGFFLAGAGFFEVLYPFGYAWFAAMAFFDRRYAPVAMVAVFCGGLWFNGDSALFLGVTLLTEALALAVCFAAKRESGELLSAAVFGSLLIVGGCHLIMNGISDILLVITLTESILAAGFAPILLKAVKVCHRIGKMERPGRGDILCIFLLAGGVLLGMERLAVYSVSPAAVVMSLLILFAAYYAGAGGGAAAGAVLGVIPSLAAAVSPAAIGMYAFSGFLAGIFAKPGRLGVVFGYLLGNILLSLYLLNTTVTTATMIQTLVGAVIFPAIPKKYLDRLGELLKGRNTVAVKGVKRDRNEDYALARLSETGRNLSALRTTLKDLHKETEPQSEKNVGAILDHISAKVCDDCSLQKTCWESERGDTLRDLMRIFALAEANDGVAIKDMPSAFRRRCCHQKEIAVAVNCLYELYRKNEYWQRQAVHSRDLAMAQMDQTLSLLNDLQTDMSTRRERKELLYRRLGAELRKNGVRVDRIVVAALGDDDVTLKLKTRHCPGNRRCEKQLAAAISKLMGRAFVTAECRCGDLEGDCACHYRCVSRDALGLEVGSVQLPREGSAVSGDSAAAVMLGGGREALVISDGMGSGMKAKRESEWTVDAVKEVLESGYDRDFAAGLVRYRMAMDRAEDIYATMDLCVVDRLRREAEFIKVGAGDSYLCSRKNGAKVIHGGGERGRGAFMAPPSGAKERLASGDIIVLASDGVGELPTGEVADWIAAIVTAAAKEPPKVIGDRILSEALKLSGGKIKDDITVTVAKVV